jgi:hypothetical protein
MDGTELRQSPYGKTSPSLQWRTPMHLSRRVLLSGALAVLFLSLPAAGIAAGTGDPMRVPAGAPVVRVPAAPAPSLVPGATVGTVGISDAFALADAAGETLVNVYPMPNNFVYNSESLRPVLAALGLPAGATLWQVDVYGYAMGATTQSWALLDEDTTSGGGSSTAALVTTSSGPGIVTATMSFPTGLMLAPGHSWKVDLYGTSASSGFTGAVFQYTLPTVSLVPITPVRVFDSRFSSKIVQGAPRTINAKDAINIITGAVTIPNAIPQGARAVSFTITVTGTSSGGGYVTVLPGTTTTVTVSTINWTSSGTTLASGGIVSLGTGTAERQVTLVVGGSGSASTHVIFDVTGYFK